MNETARRPSARRSLGLAKKIAAICANANVTTTQIGIARIAAALIGGAALAYAGLFVGGVRIGLLIVGVMCVQLRLLCDKVDAMAAAEGGERAPAGAVWNALFDRFCDIAILVGAGYGAFWAGVADSALGWAAASFAVVAAYVRELARAMGAPPDCSGPLGKPQRMELITGGALVAVFEPLWSWHGHAMAIALTIITLGSAYTAYARAARLAKFLKANVR